MMVDLLKFKKKKKMKEKKRNKCHIFFFNLNYLKSRHIILESYLIYKHKYFNVTRMRSEMIQGQIKQKKSKKWRIVTSEDCKYLIRNSTKSTAMDLYLLPERKIRFCFW